MSIDRLASVWRPSAAPIFPPLTQDCSVDVAVVGGGITGLTAALLLKRAGLSVAVIEALQVEGGDTAYTTAHVTEVLDVRYHSLIEQFGEETARLVVQSQQAAIARIAKFVQEERIDCQFQRVLGYLYTESTQDLPQLKAEVDAAQRLGVQANFTTTVPLPFQTLAGMVVQNQAQFQPVAYLRSLAQAIHGESSYVFEQTRLMDIEGSSPYQLHTQRGRVKARQVILATHTPVHDIANLQELYLIISRLVPYRSYVIGVQLRSPFPSGLFWDMDEPYHYTRGYQDEQGERVIVGGGDHQTGAKVNAVDHLRQLEAYVRSHYDVASVDYHWSAQYYESVDGLPFIGKSPVHDQLYLATGYAGNGITYGTLAAMLLSDQLLGRWNPWQPIYEPTRLSPLSTTPDLISQNLNTVTRFIGDRFQDGLDNLEAVPRSEGRLVNLDGEQVAAYRDESGVLYAFSPVCSHAGCIVQWNNAERSWDCPCHGGRFSGQGQVLNGPPLKPLEPKALGK